MGKGKNTMAGKIKNTGSMYVEADCKNEGGKKPAVRKGEDLRAGR